jgi:hypothetical protein
MPNFIKKKAPRKGEKKKQRAMVDKHIVAQMHLRTHTYYARYQQYIG